jgi:acyl-CoA thioesterase FadM
MSLDGAIRDGRHTMQVRVYYEDTDFCGTVYYEFAEQLGCRFNGALGGGRSTLIVLQMGMKPT